MNTRPALTDIPTLEKNKSRAIAHSEPAMFLQEQALIEIQERLNQVNRTFKSIAIVARFPKIWQEAFPNAKIVADHDVLDLEVQTYDLVIHSLSLHWANDLIGQLIQCQRALKPDGLFLGAAFGGQTLHELRSCLAQAEADLYGGLSPRVVPMGEIRDMGDLLFRSGFALPVADSIVTKVSYANATRLMHDLRAMGEGNALAQRKKSPDNRLYFETVNRIYQDVYKADDDRILATFETIFLTGWCPDESQQKPLQPGSAACRLSDALGSQEHKLKE